LRSLVHSVTALRNERAEYCARDFWKETLEKVGEQRQHELVVSCLRFCGADFWR
jgi:hypothetical protein